MYIYIMSIYIVYTIVYIVFILFFTLYLISAKYNAFGGFQESGRVDQCGHIGIATSGHIRVRCTSDSCNRRNGICTMRITLRGLNVDSNL